MAAFDGQIIIDKLSDSYQIDFSKKLPDFSSEFADAYLVNDLSGNKSASEKQKYALIFHKNFPADLNKIFSIKELESDISGIIYDIGKIVNQTNSTEQLAVVLSMPMGTSLINIIAQKGALEENFVLNVLLEQIFTGISNLHSQNIMHGSINLKNIYYDNNTGKVYLKECISEYTGYSQPNLYETYERITCHKAGKSSLNYDADYYAFGIVIISLIFAEEPLNTIPPELIENIKFESGSFEALYNMSRLKRNIIISTRAENIIKGLLNDKIRDRWGEKEVKSWTKREAGQANISKLHKQSSATFEFDGIEYFSPKYLAQAMFKNWAHAKKYVKLNELSRWLNLTVKDPEIEKRIFALTRGGKAEVILPDDKVCRILYILDPDGPIRFKNTSITVSGLGNYLSYIIRINDIEALKEFTEILDNGLIDGWIAQQSEQDLYKVTVLGWNPRKIRIYAKKNNVGFGYERCLYELCKFLPCQSPIIAKYYTISVPTLLKSLNSLKANYKETEPLDPHIAAFICRDLEIEDNIRVKQLAGFPNIAKMREIEIAAILALAQKKHNTQGLENLSFWVRERLTAIADKLNSNIIKSKFLENLDEIAKKGDLNKLFLAAIDEKTIRKDLAGFRQAKTQYKYLGFERVKIESQRNLDKMAYRMGLRIAVLTAYLICAIAIIFVYFLNT